MIYIDVFINPIQDGFFQGCLRFRGWKKRPPPTVMELGIVIPYLKRSKKYMNHVTHPLSSAGISTFSPEITKFCSINKYRYRLHFDTKLQANLPFLESLRIASIDMFTILMMPAKMATLGLLKRKIFTNKGYGVIDSVHYVINNI